MIELFPEGFAESRDRRGVVLAAFTDESGAERLRARFGDVAVEPVPDGWEDEWKRFHRPVEIGALWVGPPWKEPRTGLMPVVIDPGRAFGTGAHPTTQLCLELLNDLKRGSLVDLGCGSGVDVEARTTDLRTDPAPSAEVAVANIDLRTIELLRPDSATVVTSGYSIVDHPHIPGFRRVERRVRANWAADLFRRQ
jgi:Ribosomal protein L11 methyltransferase (PrmA)